MSVPASAVRVRRTDEHVSDRRWRAVEAGRRSRGGSPRFIAEISHDLRTPLASLRLLVHALSDGVVEDELRTDYLARMEAEISLLGAMIDDLHALSRGQAGDPAQAREAIEPRELIERATSAMRIQAEAAGVRLGTDVSPGLPATCVSRLQVHRVLVNLIENGLRHTDVGGSVTLRGHSAPGGVELEIENEGEGIPAEARDRVFDAFYSPDSGGSPARSGLGLAIAKAIIEGQGGRIWLDEAVRGARFRIWLPATASRPLCPGRGHDPSERSDDSPELSSERCW
jgi:signal transduction histidine kinase